MFYLLLIGTFAASGALALLGLVFAAVSGVAEVGQMSPDDAMTWLHTVGALGAAAMAFWAPRTRVRAFSARFRRAHDVGRLLGAVLLAYALIWAGYLVERGFDPATHRPSASTLVLAVAVGSTVFAADLLHRHRSSPP